MVLPQPLGPISEKNSPSAIVEVDAANGDDVAEALLDAHELHGGRRPGRVARTHSSGADRTTRRRPRRARSAATAANASRPVVVSITSTPIAFTSGVTCRRIRPSSSTGSVSALGAAEEERRHHVVEREREDEQPGDDHRRA